MVMVKDEPTKTAENAAQTDQSSQKSAEGTPKTKPRTFTEEEHEALAKKRISDALATQGRDHKRVLTTAVAKAQQEAQARLDKLQKTNQELKDDLEALGEDDEDKSRLVKLLRDNQQKSEELEKKISDYEPKIAKAEDWELTELCREVAQEYEGLDAARLKRIAARTKFTDDEDKIDQIRSLADDIGQKKSAEQEKKEMPRRTDSGVTSGQVKGKAPTTEELAASTPFETEAKIKSGEWIVRGWAP